MKTLTVITTTYNRAYCLHQVYESLLRQTSDDFLWMIVDDGSTDDTRALAERWKADGRIEIVYLYKPNGGMHTARNLAYEKAETELNVIIDSDDWMTDNAVERIVAFWREHGAPGYYGIVAHNVAPDGSRIGSPFPEGVRACKQGELSDRYHVRGDKKIILRSDLARLHPFPEFPGEKFYPGSYKYRLLDQKYSVLLMDQDVCVVDYNPDSMTFDKYAQYRTCSRGFAHYRNAMISISHSPRFILRQMIHYIAESKLAKNRRIIRDSAKPAVAALCWLPGTALYHYLLRTKKKY